MTAARPNPTDVMPTVARHYILGTAGHIDHGKTTLVKALTGIDTDRLPEERRRGMTIELGFAHLVLGDARFGIVDVPGHERFVRTMVAGATGIDLALIVVAADDSVMPQTREHVEILHLLGISLGVVAVTKIDNVDRELVDLVVEDVHQLLSETALAGSIICPVSAVTGAGMEELKHALLETASKVPEKPIEPPFRMAVDRVFTVQGRGAVVTGSVLRGTVSQGDTLEIWPAGKSCRVREIQTHGEQTSLLERSRRAAINITGIDRGYLEKGVELATPGFLMPSRMIDVRLECTASYGKPLKNSTVVRLELGAREMRARMVLLEGQVLEPGSGAFAQMRCGTIMTASYGQRFIIRDENAQRTIGGGIVLKPVGHRRRLSAGQEVKSLSRMERGDEADRVEEVLRASRFVRPTDLQLCLQSGVELQALSDTIHRLKAAQRYIPIGGTEVFAVPAAVDDLLDRLTRWLDRFHRRHPELPGKATDSVLGYLERLAGKNLSRPLFDRFLKQGAVRRLGQFVCLPAFAPELSAADEKLLADMVREVREGGFQPPLIDALTLVRRADSQRWNRLATLATALGELVAIAPKLYLHTDAEKQLKDKVAALIEREGGVTVSRVRQELHSSRKYVVPYLEYLDRIGFTKRTGDVRILATSDHD